MTQKAYSLLTFEKALDDDQRIIKGLASTPAPDRSNDIVDPLGAVFKLPIPLLSQHDHSKPIGEVTDAKVTKNGIEFTAKIAKGLDYVDTAWTQIKLGLIKGVSVGFRPIEYEEFKNDNGYGIKFKKWEWFELSAVTIPANSQATISMIKSLSAPGVKDLTVKANPRDLGNTKTVSITSPSKANIMSQKSLSDQIKGFQARQSELTSSVQAILAKSADEGRTLDADEAEKHDTAMAEIASVEKHIGRLQAAEKMAISTATPVVGDTHKSAQASRSGVISVRDNLAPGIEFARYAKCLALGNGNLFQAEAIAKSQYPDNHRIHNVMKAAVSAGTTTGTTWAAPLVDYQDFAGDFLSFLRPKTIVGRFGQGGLPALRSIPFNISVKGSTSGGSAGWVGEGAAKPVTSFDFSDVNLGWAKLAAITVLSDELIRFSSPNADTLVRDLLAEALIAQKDSDFVSTSKAAVAGVSPASVTFGVTPVTASGTDEAAVKADIKALMVNFINANLSLSSGVWIMHPSMALTLGMMSTALGQPSFPGINMSGGQFFGMPVIVSEAVTSTNIILAAASEIYLAEDAVMVSASKEASIEMNTAPTGNSGTPTAASLVSMWQTNSTAIRIEQYTNWQKRRTAAVQLISGAAYVA